MKEIQQASRVEVIENISVVTLTAVLLLRGELCIRLNVFTIALRKTWSFFAFILPFAIHLTLRVTSYILATFSIPQLQSEQRTLILTLIEEKNHSRHARLGFCYIFAFPGKMKGWSVNYLNKLQSEYSLLVLNDVTRHTHKKNDLRTTRSAPK